jgi:hypothetical protein
MVIFALAIIYWRAQVKLDTERHRNLLFETRTFAAEIKNLPELTSEYTLEMLKSELWSHLESSIMGQRQQIEKLSDTPEQQNCEIVDI